MWKKKGYVIARVLPRKHWLESTVRVDPDTQRMVYTTSPKTAFIFPDRKSAESVIAQIHANLDKSVLLFVEKRP